MLSQQQLGELFPVNLPMTGHTIPGLGTRYPVTIVTFPDRSVDPMVRQEGAQVVKGMPTARDLADKQTSVSAMLKRLLKMGGESTTGHPVMKRLAGLMKYQAPTGGENYERVREDLSWRGKTEQMPKVKAI